MECFSLFRRSLVLSTVLSLFLGVSAYAGVTITVSDATDASHTGTGQCALTGTGTCGLNDAITFANADYLVNPGNAPYTIDFSVALVNVQAGLPAISAPMTIDGSFGAPRVELVGCTGTPVCTPFANGLIVDALAAATSTAGSGVVIKNLVIRNFASDGISLTGGGHQVFNCYIGVDKTGAIAEANTGAGISITTPAAPAYTYPPPSNVPFVQIGDPADATKGNVISGNGTNGISISAQHTELNVVANNKIGTDVNGTTAIPNAVFGVEISGDAFNNTIGPGNLISGNNSNTGSDGINITGAVLGPNVVNGNVIGPSKNLTNLDAVKFGNGEDGIRIDSTRADPGVTEVADITGNTIGFNTEHGILITGACEKVVVTGNFIGLAEQTPGTPPFLDIANQMDGIHISTAGHVIGGSTASLANLISANKNSGIATSATGTDLTIQGNIIGRDGTNTSNFPNILDGITLSQGGDNLIGGSLPVQGNIIAGNGRNGIKIINNSWANLIQQNSIFGNHQLVNGLGIDLDVVSDAPDPIDNSTPGPDPNLSYANFGQNAPVINTLILPSYSVGGSTTSVTWSLTTSATTPVTLDFYMSDAPGMSGNGEGQTWLFSTTTTTDITGAASATTTFPSVPTATKYITMTATSTDAVTTRPGANPNGPANNTSEFSNAVQVPDVATHFSVTAPAATTSGAPMTNSVIVTALTSTNTVATNYTGTVHFTSSDPGAVLPADSTLSSGTGTFSATLVTVGSQTITATDTVTASITGTSTPPTVVSAGAATLFIVSGPATATAGSGISITVTAKDAHNNTATGYGGTVHFTSSDGNASLPANSTLSSGTGTFPVTLRTAGNQTVTATDTVSLSITGTTSMISVSAAAANHLTVSAPASATAGSPFSFTVTAQDQFNNTATGYLGTVHFSSTDGQAVLSANYAFIAGDSGVHIFANGATLKTAGNQTITATDTVTSSITGTSNTIAVSAAAATHFTVAAPGSASHGVSFGFTVTAQDQFNNTATGYSGTVHFTSSDGAAVLPANSTLTNGTGSFSATLNTNGSQTITATDTVTSAITGTSGAINVSAGAATHFTVSASATSTAGVPFSITVTALDASNATATGYTGTVHFASSDGQAVLPPNYTFVAGDAGVHIFTGVTLKTAGNQTITATDTVTSSITGTSNTIAVSAAAATHFMVTAPASATAGAAFTFTPTAQDPFNNTATGYSGTVHFTSSDGAASLPANSTLTNGTGTFSATLNTGGSQTITATDTVTASITGASGTISVSAPATHFTVSAPSTATGGVSFSITVTALTATNATATGYSGTVHFTSTDGLAVLPANTTLTNGVGTLSATLKTAGSQTITATDTVTSAITGTTSSITVARRSRGDFNADGMSDLVWRNGSTGENQLWLMNGATVSTSAVEPWVSDTNFTIAGVGDFDGDGHADILWRNTSTGANVIWFMNGTTVSSTAYLGNLSTSWTVAAVGDFNGDGKADIAWRNTVTGDDMMYLMNGGVITTGVSLPAVPDPAWQVVAVGDVNGDGKDDLVWRNQAAGTESVWFMNGTSAPATAALPKVLDTNWIIAGAGDIDGDGKADLIWRNPVTGEVSAWLMNGATPTSTGALPNVVGSSWVVVRVGDFNGDGKADLMWHNTATGSNALWILNGISVSSSSSVPMMPTTAWTVGGKP